MENVKQKYPTILVLLVILILFVFIIVPPMTRTLYPKKIKKAVIDEPDDIVIKSLVCDKTYTSTGLSITSTTYYEDDVIIDNTIIFSNPNGVNETNLKSGEDTEWNDYKTSLDALSTVDTLKVEDDDTTIIINNDVFEKYSDNKNITNQYQDYNMQQAYYKLKGFTCTSN